MDKANHGTVDKNEVHGLCLGSVMCRLTESKEVWMCHCSKDGQRQEQGVLVAIAVLLV